MTVKAMKGKKVLFASTVFVVFAFVMSGGVSARIPEPDNIIYGMARDDAVIFTLKVNGQQITSYTMGDNPDAGDFYVLRVPMDALEPAEPGTAHNGDEANIFINDEASPAGSVILGDRGAVHRLDFITNDSDEDGMPDGWEQQIVDGDPNDDITSNLDVLPGDDFDGDGETNLAEWENVTDPTDAMSTLEEANAYTAFHFEIYRGADQTEVGGFTPSFWGARLWCWPKAGEELFSGTLTKPAGTGGAGAVDLDISTEGDEATYEKEDYAALDALITDFIAGDYKVNLEVINGSAELYHLRFTIGVPSYAENFFPDYVTVEDPLPNDTDISMTPLLDFNSEFWSYAEIRNAGTGEEVYFHFRDAGDDPADTHQVPTAHALEGNTAHTLRVDINEWGSTWLGSQTALQFTPIDTCEGDFDPDGDVDGSDLAIFLADFGRTNCDEDPPCEGDFDRDNEVTGSDLAAFAGEFGRTNCP